jgi:hypothetical protein
MASLRQKSIDQQRRRHCSSIASCNGMEAAVIAHCDDSGPISSTDGTGNYLPLSKLCDIPFRFGDLARRVQQVTAVKRTRLALG